MYLLGNWKSKFRIGSVAVMSLGLVAIAGNATASASAKSHKVSGRSPHGSLTVVTEGSAWPSLDPANPRMIPAEALEDPATQPLFYTDNQHQLVPMLATKYSISNDGLVFTIQLRRDVKFQDGTPFNAAAVVYNLERYANPLLNSECVGYLSVMKSVVATGPLTVKITLSARDASFMPVLGSQQCSIMVSPTAVQKEGANFASDPVGTGPYEYVTGTTGVSASYKFWPGYWGAIKNPLSTITIENVGDASNAYSALQSGTAQAWINLSDASVSTEVQQARQDPNLVVEKGPATSINYVTMNFKLAPFNNVLARRALMYATDPKQITTKLYGGVYKPVQGIFPPSLFGYTGNLKGYPVNNLAKATALVKSLGGLSFTLNIDDTAGWLAEAEALQAQWAQAGIKVTINPLQAPAWIGSLHALTYQALLIVSPNLTDPDEATSRWFLSSSPLTQNGLKNAQVDSLIQRGRALYAQAGRLPTYVKLNQLLGTTILPWDDLFGQTFFQIQSKSVHNWPAFTSSYVPWNLISL